MFNLPDSRNVENSNKIDKDSRNIISNFFKRSSKLLFKILRRVPTWLTSYTNRKKKPGQNQKKERKKHKNKNKYKHKNKKSKKRKKKHTDTQVVSPNKKSEKFPIVFIINSVFVLGFESLN